MIVVQGTEKDKICVDVSEEINIVNLALRDKCQVVGCVHDHVYGYNFCEKHKYLMPIPSHEALEGFQVAFIEYWKSQGKTVFQTHTYVGERLTKTFIFQQTIKKIKKRLMSALQIRKETNK